MFRMQSIHRHLAAAFVCAGALSAGAAAAADGDAEKPAFTGHIDLVSKYILRGASTTYGPSSPGMGNGGADAPEADKPVLQWGADWIHPSGVYLGYFGSMINYSYQRLGESYTDRGITDFQSSKSIENDLYGGYNGKVGDFGYTVGLTGYAYINGKHANAFETKLGVSYGDFALTAQTLLNDVVWGNKGDTYWTLVYTKPLPYEITLTTTLGYYSYKQEGKFLGITDTALGAACAPGNSFMVNGCFPGNGPISNGFRHLTIALAQPIGKTGLSWGLQAIIGGDNRFGIKQDNKLVGLLSYGF
jgi:uncharacterized protein (TIGR02001 family)